MLHLDDYTELNDFEERPLKQAKLEKLEAENEELKRELAEIKKMSAGGQQPAGELPQLQKQDDTKDNDVDQIRNHIKEKLQEYYYEPPRLKKDGSFTKGEFKFDYNLEDLETIIGEDPALESCRPYLNELDKKVVKKDGKAWEDTDTNLILKVLSKYYELKTERHLAIIERAVADYASQHSINPIKNILKDAQTKRKAGLKGKYTIEDYWIKVLGVEDDKDGYARWVTKLFFCNAVLTALHPGIPVRSVPILCGVQQVGKTTCLRRLAVQRDLFSDHAANLDSRAEKDTIEVLNRTWIAEMAEGNELRSYSAGKMKAFLSQYSYTYRPPYARSAVTVMRHTVFAITTNDSGKNLLNDKTGNTRYDVLTCDRDRVQPGYGVMEITDDDILSLWGEAMDYVQDHPEMYTFADGVIYPAKYAEIRRRRNEYYNYEDAKWDDYDSYISEKLYDTDRISAKQLWYGSQSTKSWCEYTNKDKNSVINYLNNKKDGNGDLLWKMNEGNRQWVKNLRGDGLRRKASDIYWMTEAGKSYYMDQTVEEKTTKGPESIDELFNTQFN